MDGSLIFRLILIIVSGFALVMIISCYNNSIPATDPSKPVGEQFQQMNAGGPESNIPSGIPPKYTPPQMGPPEAGVVPTLDGTLASTAGQMTHSPHPPSMVPGAIDTLKPEDLLPHLGNTPEEQKFLNANPAVAGDVNGQNFLNSGYWHGAITNVSKYGNQQIRSDPVIVTQHVSPWLNSPYEMSAPNRQFEIGTISSV